MFLKRLLVENFRNLEPQTIEFTKAVNVFLGSNGAGKTSFLEAICMLSIPKSFRSNDLKDLVQFEKNYFRVKGEFDGGLKLEVGFEALPKATRHTKVNDSKKTVRDFIENVFVSVFTPEDLYILDLGPSKRREYLNKTLSKLDFQYMDALSRYEKVMRERNAILKKINEGEAVSGDLKPWDFQLITHGNYLTKKRLEFIGIIEKDIASEYKKMSNSEDEIALEYFSKIKSVAGDDNFENALNINLQKDIITKATTVGPHRDDLIFNMNGRNMEQFASRGEKRTLLLSLKIAELDVVEAMFGKRPILILDDVFSELDNDRQTSLLEIAKKYQTFISTNSEEHFSGFSEPLGVFLVKSGSI